MHREPVAAAAVVVFVLGDDVIMTMSSWLIQKKLAVYEYGGIYR